MGIDDIIWSSPIADDFIPDGNSEKPTWAGAQQVLFHCDAFRRSAHPELETFVASVWTPQHLYLLYRCRYVTLHTYEDENPIPERWELWNRDVVETFIAPSGVADTHYYEFELAPNNQWLDLEIFIHKDATPRQNNWNSGFLHATRVDRARKMWIAEMRIPVQAMGIKQIDSDSAWRINFCRCDGLGSDRRLLSWCRLSADNHSFHQPAFFGTLRFAVPDRPTHTN